MFAITLMSMLIPVIFILLGFALFIGSFNKWREKRLVEDTPTSTVRGLSMGLVELTGKAKAWELLKSPVTQTDCVFYRYMIEEYVKEDDSVRWIPRMAGDSSLIPFYLEDETGSIPVLVQGAQYLMSEDYQHIMKPQSVYPENLTRFSGQFHIPLSQVSARGRPLRIREWHLKENDPLYVLGYAQKAEDVYKKLAKQKSSFLRTIARDRGLKARFDINKDGRIDDSELKQIERQIVSVMLSRFKDQKSVPDVSDVVIAAGAAKRTFIVSDSSQKKVAGKLTGHFFISMIFGIIMICTGFFLLQNTTFH